MPGGEKLKLRYLNVFKKNAKRDEGDAEKKLRKILEDGTEDDIRRGQTLRGIHREDFRAELGRHDARIYGSQGQQRTVMLAIRLAELDLMERWSGETPILLLDDLASELDAGRRKQLFGLIQDRVQTIITTTDPGLLDFPDRRTPEAEDRFKHFEMQEGRIKDNPSEE